MTSFLFRLRRFERSRFLFWVRMILAKLPIYIEASSSQLHFLTPSQYQILQSNQPSPPSPHSKSTTTRTQSVPRPYSNFPSSHLNSSRCLVCASRWIFFFLIKLQTYNYDDELTRHSCENVVEGRSGWLSEIAVLGAVPKHIWPQSHWVTCAESAPEHRSGQEVQYEE